MTGNRQGFFDSSNHPEIPDSSAPLTDLRVGMIIDAEYGPSRVEEINPRKFRFSDRDALSIRFTDVTEGIGYVRLYAADRTVGSLAVDDPEIRRLMDPAERSHTMSDRPPYCCGVCPPTARGGYDCTCRGNPSCPEASDSGSAS